MLTRDLFAVANLVKHRENKVSSELLVLTTDIFELVVSETDFSV